MKSLIVEDDFTSRLYLQELLKEFGPAHIAVNGREAIDATEKARDDGQPYDLICMDIMMPIMDGQQALQRIRAVENERNINYGHGVKVIMITALSDMKNVTEAFSKGLADSYISKPIDRSKIIQELQSIGLID